MASYSATQTVAADRNNIVRSAQGIISETSSRLQSVSNRVCASGTVYYGMLPLLRGDIVTSFVLNVLIAASATATLSRIGLYSPAGLLLASTVDQGQLLTAVGQYVVAASVPYTVSSDGAYYAAVITVGATPNLSCGASTGTVNSPVALSGGLIPFGIQSGQTDLPSSAAISAAAQVANIWIAVI